MPSVKILPLVLISSLLLISSGFASENDDFYVAQKAFSEGFYEASKKLFEKFIVAYPESKRQEEAKLFIAKNNFYLNKFNQAEEEFLRLLNVSESKEIKGESLYWLGELNFRAKKYDQAIKYLQKVQDYPKTSMFWWASYSLGFSYLKQGKDAQAKDEFLRVIQANPEKELKQNAYSALAQLYYKNKDYSNLEVLVNGWVKEFPEISSDSLILFYFAESKYFSKEFAQAIIYYKKSLKNIKDATLRDSVFQGLGWSSLEQKDFDEAENWFLKISSGEIKFYSLATLYFKKKDYTQAQEYYDQFIKNFTESPFLYKVYLGKAESLYSLGRINDAITFYRKIIDLESRIQDRQLVEEAYFGLGWCFLKLNDYRKAIEQFKKVSRFSYDSILKISAQINIGDAYQESGNLKEALEIYEKVIKDFPSSLYSDYIQLQIGLCFLKQNDFEASILAFENLIKNFPESILRAEALYYIALSYASLGNYQESAVMLEDYVRTYFQSKYIKEAYLLLIQVYIGKKEYPKALRIFDEISKRFTKDAYFLEKVQIQKGLFYIDQKRYDIAKKTFQHFLNQFPNSEFQERILLYLANMYHQEKDYTKAQNYYRQVIESSPVTKYASQARLDLAQILWERQEFEKAEDVLRQNLSNSSKEMALQTNLTLIEFLINKSEFEQALSLCSNLIERHPGSKQLILFKKAKIYQEQEDYPKAYENLLKAKEAGFDSANLRFSMGYVLEKMGKPEEAIKSFFDSIYIFPEEQKTVIKSYLRIGRLYEKLGRFQEAKKAYNKIIDMKVQEAKYAKEKLNEIEEKIKSLAQ